ncbi:MAG: hypothetical protein WBA54_15335 [Acidaminobacteraceae bacterium]
MNSEEKIVKSIAITTDNGRMMLENAKLIEEVGIENDQAHSEIRQISIVSEKFIVNNTTNEVGFCHKKFKENLIIMHLDVKSLVELDKFIIGDCVIEITKVFKKCHDNCPKLQDNESCQLNEEVVFAKVVKTGYIKKEDLMIKL